MNKIVFAINHRQTENIIDEHIASEYRIAGAVTYREAVIEQLRDTQADALLIRENLPGSTPIVTLLKQIRVSFSDTRIILICNERPKNDPFLKELVGLGIYDIINSNSPRLSDIVSYILSPRTFKDVAQYGVGLASDPSPSLVPSPASPPAAKPVSKGSEFFSNFKKGVSMLWQKNSAPAASEPKPVSDFSQRPNIDVETLRQSIKVSEARKAQSELDSLVKDAVEKQTGALLKQIADLKEAVKKAQAEVAIAEANTVAASEQANRIRSEKDELLVALTNSKAETQRIINLYESQLKALNDPVNTPEWYKEQSGIWESERNRLRSELDAVTKEAESLQIKCELLETQAQTNSEQITTLNEQLSKAKDVQVSGADVDGVINQLRSELTETKANVMQMEMENAKL